MTSTLNARGVAAKVSISARVPDRRRMVWRHGALRRGIMRVQRFPVRTRQAGATPMLDSGSVSTFTYPVRVASPRVERAQIDVKLKCLVDPSAMFSCLPRSQLEGLGLSPTWRVPIVLADGRQEEWGATEILMTIDERTLHTTCLFGPSDSLPFLGAVSLEQFALAVDPLARALVPTRVPMA